SPFCSCDSLMPGTHARARATRALGKKNLLIGILLHFRQDAAEVPTQTGIGETGRTVGQLRSGVASPPDGVVSGPGHRPTATALIPKGRAISQTDDRGAFIFITISS